MFVSFLAMHDEPTLCLVSFIEGIMGLETLGGVASHLEGWKENREKVAVLRRVNDLYAIP